MRFYPLTLAIFICAASSKTLAATVDDNFNDNTPAPQWSIVTDHPSLNVIEQNQRLEVISAPSNSPINDALYLSTGATPFRLSTSSNFEIAIDYHFSTPQNAPTIGSQLGLVFGVGRDLDGTDSAAIGYFYTRQDIGIPITLGGVGVGHRTDDVQFEDAVTVAANSGTFTILYDASADDLSFKVNGGSAVYTLTDTVRTIWGADDVLVSFGARGSGFATQSGEAWFDNFVVQTGTIVPEPATIGILAGALITLLMRHRAGA